MWVGNGVGKTRKQWAEICVGKLRLTLVRWYLRNIYVVYVPLVGKLL